MDNDHSVSGGGSSSKSPADFHLRSQLSYDKSSVISNGDDTRTADDASNHNSDDQSVKWSIVCNSDSQ